jgi:hypothetical protein
MLFVQCDNFFKEGVFFGKVGDEHGAKIVVKVLGGQLVQSGTL